MTPAWPLNMKTRLSCRFSPHPDPLPNRGEGDKERLRRIFTATSLSCVPLDSSARRSAAQSDAQAHHAGADRDVDHAKQPRPAARHLAKTVTGKEQ